MRYNIPFAVENCPYYLIDLLDSNSAFIAMIYPSIDKYYDR